VQAGIPNRHARAFHAFELDGFVIGYSTFGHVISGTIKRPISGNAFSSFNDCFRVCAGGRRGAVKTTKLRVGTVAI